MSVDEAKENILAAVHVLASGDKEISSDSPVHSAVTSQNVIEGN